MLRVAMKQVGSTQAQTSPPDNCVAADYNYKPAGTICGCGRNAKYCSIQGTTVLRHNYDHIMTAN